MTEPTHIAIDALRIAGPVVVAAPHPDDESIGCGGAIALLRDRGILVDVLLLSDGAASHPNSRRFPAAARRQLRRAELHAALAALDASDAVIAETALADGDVPGPSHPGFSDAVDAAAALLVALAPRTLLLPWRRDPHRDHRAANAIIRTANARIDRPARELEYTVWLEECGVGEERLQPGEGVEVRLDIAVAVDRKQRAIAAHRSQLGLVIDDDPAGFTLSPAMLERCAQPWETYFSLNRTTRP